MESRWEGENCERRNTTQPTSADADGSLCRYMRSLPYQFNCQSASGQAPRYRIILEASEIGVAQRDATRSSRWQTATRTSAGSARARLLGRVVWSGLGFREVLLLAGPALPVSGVSDARSSPCSATCSSCFEVFSSVLSTCPASCEKIPQQSLAQAQDRHAPLDGTVQTEMRCTAM